MALASLVGYTPPSPPLAARHSVYSTPHSRCFAAYQTYEGGTDVKHCIGQNKMENPGSTRNMPTLLVDENAVAIIPTFHNMLKTP